MNTEQVVSDRINGFFDKIELAITQLIELGVEHSPAAAEFGLLYLRIDALISLIAPLLALVLFGTLLLISYRYITAKHPTEGTTRFQMYTNNELSGIEDMHMFTAICLFVLTAFLTGVSILNLSTRGWAIIGLFYPELYLLHRLL